MKVSIAWFITPHGYGHATRSIALMVAIRRRRPEVHFHIFSVLAPNLFQESLGDGFSIHPTQCDVGLSQRSAMDADLDATLERLAALLPFRPEILSQLADTLLDLNCKAVVSDISAMGIAVAERANVPSILVENFTWDWIYQPYVKELPEFAGYCKLLRFWYRKAMLHIQAQPLCQNRSRSLEVGPIARPMTDKMADFNPLMRQRAGRSLVLITMGGVAQPLQFLAKLHSLRDQVLFLLAGESETVYDNIISLKGCPVYHPNLVANVDLVIAKLGYSTVAEVYQAGVPLVYVARKTFRESATLSRFVRALGNTRLISEDQFLNGNWIKHLPGYLKLPHNQKPIMNGSDRAADAILAMMG